MKEDKKGRLLTKEELINEMFMYAQKALKEHIPVVAIDPMRPTIDTPQVTFIHSIASNGIKPYPLYYCQLEDGRAVDIFNIRMLREELHFSDTND